MHTVTFYSFKGGVGRTMALVNTAALLARRGQRVLLVDFDLEAPGLSTYGPLDNAKTSKGIVEYVSDYLETRSAPDAKDYMAECALGDQSVWVMPAGYRDESYSSRLNSIDWQDLYERHNGYLMFEDLKHQWAAEGFQYVLIDSRTGHTDVGGICTRQLPDAAVLMFFPNDQNMIGLQTVVSEIRNDEARVGRSAVILHFCASNVPDLDDEEQILERKLKEAQLQLGYVDAPAVVHHYNSLSLLEQSIFVLDRRHSKLAREYEELEHLIAASNLGDKLGALSRLQRIREIVRLRRGSAGAAQTEVLSKIDSLHERDAQVQQMLASVHRYIGDISAEMTSLNKAIENGLTDPSAKRRRAEIYQLLGRGGDAKSDLYSVLQDANTNNGEFVAALEILIEIDRTWLTAVAPLIASRSFSANDTIRLANLLLTEEDGVDMAIPLLEYAIDSAEDDVARVKSRAQNQLLLALIHKRMFSRAIEVSGLNEDTALHANDIALVFNFAMAQWGVTGEAPQALMAHVVALDANSRDPSINQHQCLALAFFVLGKSAEATRRLAAARSLLTRTVRAFSCWRYLEVHGRELSTDFDEMAQLISGDRVVPRVFRKPLRVVM